MITTAPIGRIATRNRVGSGAGAITLPEVHRLIVTAAGTGFAVQYYARTDNAAGCDAGMHNRLCGGVKDVGIEPAGIEAVEDSRSGLRRGRYGLCRNRLQ